MINCIILNYIPNKMQISDTGTKISAIYHLMFTRYDKHGKSNSHIVCLHTNTFQHFKETVWSRDKTFNHDSDVSWVWWHIKSLATYMFTHQLVQDIIKESIRAQHYCPLRGIQWWLVDSPHKGPVMWKMHPIYDIMCVFKWCKILALMLRRFI